MVELTENLILMNTFRQIAVEIGELCLRLDFSLITESVWPSLQTCFCSKEGIAEGLKQGGTLVTNV